MLKLKELLSKIVNRLNVLGGYYTCSWTASSSTANNTPLTWPTTLSEGIYIAVINAPTLSADLYVAICETTANAPFTGHYHLLKSGGGATEVIHISDSSKQVVLKSAQSASVTMSYLGRGYLRFVRVR